MSTVYLVLFQWVLGMVTTSYREALIIMYENIDCTVPCSSRSTLKEQLVGYLLPISMSSEVVSVLTPWDDRSDMAVRAVVVGLWAFAGPLSTGRGQVWPLRHSELTTGRGRASVEGRPQGGPGVCWTKWRSLVWSITPRGSTWEWE